MRTSLPGIVNLARSTRLWLFLVAFGALPCCSCSTVSPIEKALVNRRNPRHVPNEQAMAIQSRQPAGSASSAWPADNPLPAGRSGGSTEQRRVASGQRAENTVGLAEVVTPGQLNRRAKAAFPAVQAGYQEPLAAVPAGSAPVANSVPVVTALPPAPNRQDVRGRLLPVAVPNQPVRQASYAAAAGPPAGHACPNCAAGGYHRPGTPIMPHDGNVTPWAKPWQYGPWPADEYICNGGDNDLSVLVADDWSVVGLHEGDTVAHYDTLDGKVVVEPSNEVCLYAPRFAAVRKVTGVKLHEQHLRSAGFELPVHLAQSNEAASATTVLQPLQPGRNLAISSANRFRDKTRSAGIEYLQAPAGIRDGFLPFEDFLIIRNGTFDNSEKARLSEHLQAAYTWSRDASVQVVVDNIDVLEASSEVGMQSVYTYEMPDGKPRLRVVKVASKQNAQPGDIVDFTIRFDNVGDRVIGNVTLLDNLNTRLEYVPDSQECTLQAEFFAPDNEHESAVLRWEIAEPMKVGTGGVIRFQCRVR